MYSVFFTSEKPGKNDKICGYLQLSGFKVLEKETGEVAQSRKMMQESDLVLIHENRMDTCVEVCEFIRMFTQIPIIILSENNDEWEKIRLFRAGADDYITEPCLQGELIARMQSHIGRYQRLTKPFGYIESGELVIEAMDRRVLLQGEEVVMTIKEFDVLLYLAKRPNQVVRKEEIYTEVWSDELGKGYYNAVAVYINRIRRKIEADPYNPQYIETVWGIGYRFRNHKDML